MARHMRGKSAQNRSSHRFLRFETLEHRQLLSGVGVLDYASLDSAEAFSRQPVITMSDQEQFVLEELNRTRLDPEGACERYGVDLNEGLPAGTISADPKQPLAPHSALITAASDHSQDMSEREYFDHKNPEGLQPWDRARTAGYTGSYISENIAWGYSCYSVNGGWFNSSGHRKNMMQPQFTEVGIGIFGTHSTELFGRGTGHSLTGIVYLDGDGDEHFNVGEGLEGVTVSAGAYITQTGPSGAWCLKVPDGDYTVTAAGGDFGAAVAIDVQMQELNVEVDFLAGRPGALINYEYVEPGIQTDAAQFVEGRGLYEAWNGFGVDYRGHNEKYFADQNGTWYAILPSGNIYTSPWVFDETTLVASLDSMYWQDPNKLFGVASPETLAAYQFAHDRDLVEKWTGWGLNHRERNERYFYSNTEDRWYAILPNGEVHASARGWIFDQTSLVVTLSEEYWQDPNRLIYAANPNGLKGYQFTNGQGMVQTWTDWRYDERGYREKYFSNKYGTVFAILPNGQVHVEADIFNSHSFYAALCGDYYYDTSLLFVYR